MYLAKTLQIVQAFPHAGAPGSGTREQQWLEAGKDLQRVQVSRRSYCPSERRRPHQTSNPPIHRTSRPCSSPLHFNTPTDKMDTEKLARMQNAARTGECCLVVLRARKLAKLMELPY